MTIRIRRSKNSKLQSQATSELSPPQAGSPHVTTDPSDLMAAKAPSLGTTCCTSVSSAKPWIARLAPHVTTDASSLIATNAESVATTWRTPRLSLREMAWWNQKDRLGGLSKYIQDQNESCLTWTAKGLGVPLPSHFERWWYANLCGVQWQKRPVRASKKLRLRDQLVACSGVRKPNTLDGLHTKKLNHPKTCNKQVQPYSLRPSTVVNTSQVTLRNGHWHLHRNQMTPKPRHFHLPWSQQTQLHWHWAVPHPGDRHEQNGCHHQRLGHLAILMKSRE